MTNIAATLCFVAALGLVYVTAVSVSEITLANSILMFLSTVPFVILIAIFKRSKDKDSYAISTKERVQNLASELRELTKELTDAQKQLKAGVTAEDVVDKGKTDFVSLVTHQLVTPMSTINWYSEMLINGDAGALNTEQEQYLQIIYSGSQRMADLVYALLNVSRLEMGTFVVQPEPINIITSARQTVQEFTKLLARKGISINEHYSEVPEINADKNLLAIIFRNLLSNAIQYSPDNGSVSVAISVVNDSAQIIIKDSGMGIPDYQQKEIFSKLFRADNARESEVDGTGLGLYIAKYIIDYTGGSVTFDSSESGTQFEVLLPLSGMEKKEGTKRLTSISRLNHC
ncbi:MAG: signal transduction histidine kinase [Acidimicrobiales bacterium]|jgi:signal transduction histidine kinase